MSLLPDAEEGSVDWDKGLPPDVLDLIVKAGGLAEMVGMRGVSKSWQEGYELSVSKIKTHPLAPQPPPTDSQTLHPRLPWLRVTNIEAAIGATPLSEDAAAHRFPHLNWLDLSGAPEDNQIREWLKTLRALPQLRSVTLGGQHPTPLHNFHMPFQLPPNHRRPPQPPPGPPPHPRRAPRVPHPDRHKPSGNCPRDAPGAPRSVGLLSADRCRPPAPPWDAPPEPHAGWLC